MNQPASPPRVWLLLTPRLEGGAVPGPILQLGKLRPGRAAQAAPFPLNPVTSAAKPETSGRRRGLQPSPVRPLGEPRSGRISDSRLAQRAPSPGSATAGAASHWPLAPRAFRHGRELIGRARQPSVFESAAGGRTPGLRASRSVCSVRRPAGKAAKSRARGSVPPIPLASGGRWPTPTPDANFPPAPPAGPPRGPPPARPLLPGPRRPSLPPPFQGHLPGPHPAGPADALRLRRLLVALLEGRP